MKKLQHPPELSATRWTLFELFVMVFFAAVASFFVSSGAVNFGVLLFLTAVFYRIAIVDFSFVGSVASGLVLFFGIPTLFCAVLLMIT